MSTFAPSPTDARSNRILIVDDQKSIRMLLQATLESAGYAVEAVEDAPRALECVHAEEFAVVITDYQMEPMNGLEFLKAVRDIHPQSSRIMVSAFADVNLMTSAIEQGKICRFLVKPWVREGLLKAVQEAYQRYRDTCQEATLELNAAAMNEELKKLNASLVNQLAQREDQKRELERLNGALQQNLQRSAELCLHALETFYPSVGITARRARALCSAMAEDLKLPSKQRRALETSALLYDIGLLGIRQDLINRWLKSPQTLNDTEKSLIKRHPLIGQELATFIEDLKDVGAIIRAHHERHDGSGYPDGLRGEEIPWLARLLAVAIGYAEHQKDGQDALQAVTTAAGKEFDPEAVRELVRSVPQAVLPRQQRGLLVSELKPGMILASNVYNSQGMLIIPGDRPLNENWIAKLKAHDRVSPLNLSLQVYS